MSDLDVIIPVCNEEENIEELIKRLDRSLSEAGISYNAIFVDDHSTDSTVSKIKSLSDSKNFTNGELKLNQDKVIYDAKTHAKLTNGNASRIMVLSKRGPKGKAFSILEGAAEAKSSYIAMIEADLQYPPEAIPNMFRMAQKYEVVVANRKNNKTHTLRRIASRLNRFFFGKLFGDLGVDVQSGLKIFRKEIIKNLSEDGITAWTLDLPLLRTALDLGFKIGSYDIDFDERKKGKSKVNLLKASFEIAKAALELKFRGSKVYFIKPRTNKNPLGAGIIYKGVRFITHTGLSLEKSAFFTFTGWQKFGLTSCIFLFFLGLVINPRFTLVVFIAFLTLIYLLDFVFSAFVIIKSLYSSPEIKISEKELNSLNEKELPIYSILCPLYKEAKVLPQLVSAIRNLDWPKDRLEVILLVEEDDEETLTALKTANIPFYFKVVVVPDCLPKTKPKACNLGLALAKGEYIVVYDAEDIPEARQLKKAYLAFQKLSQDVVCLQSKLNYYNLHQNLLTRLFAAEYALWFDIILPGFQCIGTAIPLGGTSNHFKTKFLKSLRGWDPFNVTEDCDLGARLFREGFKTAILDSITLEEANSRISSWIRQRSRWIKGYLQTYLVHTRKPFEFIKEFKIQALVFQLVIGARMIFILVNPLLWFLTISYFALYQFVAQEIESLYPPLVFYPAVILLIFGNFCYFYSYMIACVKRGYWDLVKYIFLIPFYWGLASFSAILAFYQLIKKPYYWEKTEHGLHLKMLQTKVLPYFSLEIPNFANLGVVKSFYLSLRETFENISSTLGRLVLELLALFEEISFDCLSHSRLAKILVFNWRDTKHNFGGGAEVYIHEIAKRLVKRGFAVYILCSWDGKSKREEVIDGVYVIRRGGFFTVYILAFLYYVLKFRKKFDIVIDSENGIPFFTPLFVEVPKLLIIYHIHQEIFLRYLSFPLSQIAKFLEKVLMPFVYKYIPVITISESSKADIVKLGWDPSMIEIIKPGVDRNYFKRSQKTPYPSFVYLGRVKPWKNIDIAIKAFAKICAKFPDAKLTIAGFGEVLPELYNLAKSLGVEKRVSFLGRVDNRQKTKLFAESWAALQPSSCEGWGMTVIEANACGTCVIASDVKGLRDSVLDNTTGILFSLRREDALAEAMEKIITDKNFRTFLSQNAYLWANSFSWDVTAQRFEYLILDYLKKYQLIPNYLYLKSKT